MYGQFLAYLSKESTSKFNLSYSYAHEESCDLINDIDQDPHDGLMDDTEMEENFDENFCHTKEEEVPLTTWEVLCQPNVWKSISIFTLHNLVSMGCEYVTKLCSNFLNKSLSTLSVF